MKALIAALALCFAATGAWATEPKNLEDVRATISGLGDEVGSVGPLLRIKIDSSYSYPIYFSVNHEVGQLTIFVVLEDVPEDRVGSLPATAILRFNDAHFDYLSLNQRKGGLRFVLQTNFPLAAATPDAIKQAITRLVTDANGSEQLWNPANWPKP